MPHATQVVPALSFKLNTGASIPSVGLGTWQAGKGEVAAAVEHALRNGYKVCFPSPFPRYPCTSIVVSCSHSAALSLEARGRFLLSFLLTFSTITPSSPPFSFGTFVYQQHIDAALIYQNENEVGEGIKASGVDRSEIFLTSKLFVPSLHSPFPTQADRTYIYSWNSMHDDVEASLEESLASLGVDYLDLFLVHWPVRLVANESSRLLPVNPDGSRSVDRDWDQAKTWAGMERVFRSGKVKAIGLCNWSVPYLEQLEKSWTVVPAVNQVELHPFNPSHKLKAWCDERGILMEAYSPLGSTSTFSFRASSHTVSLLCLFPVN